MRHCIWAEVRAEDNGVHIVDRVSAQKKAVLAILHADIEPVLQPHCKKRMFSVCPSFYLGGQHHNHQQGGKGVGPELEGAPTESLQTTSGHRCPSGILPSR